jgi:6-phosphogluconolactonase
MPSPGVSIRVLADAAQLAQFAAEQFCAAAGSAISARGVFLVALSGGSTPQRLYAMLAADPYFSRIEWAKVQVYFSDERCVPPEHPDSNYRMAEQALLHDLPMPRASIHRMRGEIDPQEAAKEYGILLKSACGDGGLDLALLGLGEDAHTASLFPKTAALEEREHRCVANFVQKLNAWRLTMTAPFINRTAQILFLVSGSAKAQAVRDVLEGPRDPQRFPAQWIQPQGDLLWLLDAAAAGMDEAE